MGISLNTILAALAGGMGGYQQGLDRQHQLRRQDMLDQQMLEDRASQREAREYANIERSSRMAENGVLPASAIPAPDQQDFSGAISAGVGAVGGISPGLPAKLPDPKRYSPVGSAGGQPYYYNPESTKEAKAAAAKDATRAAEVTRFMQFEKPGTKTKLSRAEAEAVVDGNARLSDFETKPSPYGAEARSMVAYREGFRVKAAEAAAARKRAAGTNGMEIDEREKYLNSVADRLVAASAQKVGEDGDILHAADNYAVSTPEGRKLMAEGLRSPHVRAAVQRFKDRFTAKSKQESGDDPFSSIGGTAPTPVTAAPARPAPSGKPVAPDSLVAELARKHRGNVEAVANELAARGFDPTQ